MKAVFTCTQKLTHNQLSLPHGAKKWSNEENFLKNKKPTCWIFSKRSDWDVMVKI